MCCRCPPRCSRIIIVISSILMILIGIAFIILCCIPKTLNSVSFYPSLSTAVKVVGIVLGIFCIVMGGIGITSTIPNGYCKICLCIFYIIGMKIVFAAFIALFILSLFLQGAGYSSDDIVNGICDALKGNDVEKIFSNIKSRQTSCPTSATCPSKSTVLSCSSQTYLLGGFDTSTYSSFLDFYGSVEADKKCSGLCPGDRLRCYDFSDITQSVPTNAESCLFSIYDSFRGLAVGLCIVTSIVWFFALINFIAGYCLCCSKDD